MDRFAKISSGLLKIIVLLAFLITGYFNQDLIADKTNLDIEEFFENYNSEEVKTRYGLHENLTEDFNLSFCPSSKCYDVFVSSFNSAQEEIFCAFYELDIVNLSSVLLDKSSDGIDVRLIIDNKYLGEEGLMPIKDSKIKIYSDTERGTRYDNYMHDKFCVIDNKILITGSANPTENGFYKNNNNIIKLISNYLAANYKNEFMQMASGKFGYNKKSILEYDNLTLNYENESYFISSYMCPQDNCDKEILRVLGNARNEIIFAAFAFTHDDIENILLEKNSNGINVKGIIEKRSINLKGSRISELAKEFPIKNDTNPNTMHHKFFIIDGEWVITGSMNPSASGANYNDENILIIKSNSIAKMFIEEFEKLYE